MNTLSAQEYEPQLPHERERKYLVDNPSILAGYEYQSYLLEQIYLSNPNEPFSLRLRRKTGNDGQTEYSAALKTRSPKPEGPLDRVEIETPISERAYEYYASQPDFPRLSKLRADLALGVSCDWLPQVTCPMIEVEDTTEGKAFIDRHWLGMTEATHDLGLQNESLAHAAFRMKNGSEAISVPEELQAGRIYGEAMTILEHKKEPVVIGIKGRSGSGKTTLANELKFLLEGEAPIIHLSTDDYHRGKKWLLSRFRVDKWLNWDDPVVYNTRLMAWELSEYLSSGEPIPRRQFDFASEEPVQDDTFYETAGFIIVEGLFPHSPDLKNVIDLNYEVPTPLATCIGRRIMRDIGSRLNDSFLSAEDVLRYQLEVAEPTYVKYK